MFCIKPCQSILRQRSSSTHLASPGVHLASRRRPAWRLLGQGVRWAILLMLAAGSLPGLADETTPSEKAGSIPEVLQPWRDWVLWGIEHRNCPTPYSSADQPICFWPTRLEVTADESGGTFSAEMRVFEETWIPLPGSTTHPVCRNCLPVCWPRKKARRANMRGAWKSFRGVRSKASRPRIDPLESRGIDTTCPMR